MKINVNKNLDLESVPDFFISVAILVNKYGDPNHAGILLKFENKLYLCHYAEVGNKPIIEEYKSNKYYFNVIKSLDIRTENEVRRFYEWLRIICSKTKINYGFQLTNEKYNLKGEFNGENGEIGTCVSFCLYLINSFIIDGDSSFFHIDDWDDSNIDEDNDIRFRNMLKIMNSNFNEEIYLKNRKRITPIDFFTGSFHEKIPVRKKFVDEHIDLVKLELQKLDL